LRPSKSEEVWLPRGRWSRQSQTRSRDSPSIVIHYIGAVGLKLLPGTTGFQTPCKVSQNPPSLKRKGLLKSGGECHGARTQRKAIQCPSKAHSAYSYDHDGIHECPKLLQYATGIHTSHRVVLPALFPEFQQPIEHAHVTRARSLQARYEEGHKGQP